MITTTIPRKPPPQVVVLGASGYVGGAIMLAAAQTHHLSPIASIRQGAGSYRGIETRICNATDVEAVTRALDGATYAVNCVLGSPSTMIAATHNLCTAARSVGLRRIIHLSSMAVYGAATGAVDETAAVRPISKYGHAKAECERIVHAFIATGGDAVVVRPGCVYGPEGEQWVGRIARWLRSGRLGVIGEMGDGFCNLTFNDDLAAAVVELLIAPDVSGETYNVVDPDPMTWNQYFSNLGRGIDVQVRSVAQLRVYMEAAFLAPPLQALKMATKRLGSSTKRLPEPITPSLLQLWRQPIWVDSHKVYSTLKFARTSPQEGLTRSAAWFRLKAARDAL